MTIALPATTAVLGQWPVGWLVSYVFSHGLHLWVLLYWGMCLAAATPAIHTASAVLEKEAPPVVNDPGQLDEAVQKAWLRRRRLFYRKLYVVSRPILACTFPHSNVPRRHAFMTVDTHQQRNINGILPAL
jgi:hypothetical protein